MLVLRSVISANSGFTSIVPHIGTLLKRDANLGGHQGANAVAHLASEQRSGNSGWPL